MADGPVPTEPFFALFFCLSLPQSRYARQLPRQREPKKDCVITMGNPKGTPFGRLWRGLGNPSKGCPNESLHTFFLNEKVCARAARAQVMGGSKARNKVFIVRCTNQKGFGVLRRHVPLSRLRSKHIAPKAYRVADTATYRKSRQGFISRVVFARTQRIIPILHSSFFILTISALKAFRKGTCLLFSRDGWTRLVSITQ